MIETKNKIKKLTKERNDLKQKVEALRITKQNREKLQNEQRQIEQRKKNEEKDFLKHQKQALASYLKTEFGK